MDGPFYSLDEPGQTNEGYPTVQSQLQPAMKEQGDCVNTLMPIHHDSEQSRIFNTPEFLEGTQLSSFDNVWSHDHSRFVSLGYGNPSGLSADSSMIPNACQTAQQLSFVEDDSCFPAEMEKSDEHFPPERSYFTSIPNSLTPQIFHDLPSSAPEDRMTVVDLTNNLNEVRTLNMDVGGIAQGCSFDSRTMQTVNPPTKSTPNLMIPTNYSVSEDTCNNPVAQNRNHSTVRQHECAVCGRTYIYKKDLIKHQRMKHGKKELLPYPCEYCGRRFLQISNLKRHLLAHSGEKPFTCTVCYKTFSQSSNLNVHARVHTGEKPFLCTICKRGFSRREHLRKHASTHT